MEPTKKPSEMEKFWARYPLYVRMGWALIIVFGLVGNCAGKREASLAVFIIASILWACTRMIQEGIDAYRILTMAKKHDQDAKDAKKDEPPAPPPGPPAAT
jgi:hypothetical protein